jgi:hypothetical protein
MIFKFKLTTKQDVHFNLIGPVDELALSVYNHADRFLLTAISLSLRKILKA